MPKYPAGRRPVMAADGCGMPVPGSGTPAGSVPLDALDAGQIADLPAAVTAVTAATAVAAVTGVLAGTRHRPHAP